MMKPFFADHKEEALVGKVLEIFITKGIKVMTMDDIAVDLRVSKKTLYKYVKNRHELVQKAAELKMHYDRENIKAIMQNGLNSIEENIAICEYNVETLLKMNPQVHYDMYHYFTKAARVFDDFKMNFMVDVSEANILKGQKEGLFRYDVDARILSIMLNNKLDMVFNGNIFPSKEFAFSEVYTTFIFHHIRGLCTSKGIATLEKLNDNFCNKTSHV